jgi:hypothetical protein
MKVWIILIMTFMSLGVSMIISRLAVKIWGKEVRVTVFVIVFVVIWLFFLLGVL